MDGVLVPKSKRGLHPLGNPSERRPGRKRFWELCKHFAAWRKCAASLGHFYDQRDSIDMDEALAVLRQANTLAFKGKPDYKHMRLIRALCLLMNKPLKDTEASWKRLQCMSRSVKNKVKSYGIHSYGTALKFRDSSRRRLEDDSYNLDNLICFICLAV